MTSLRFIADGPSIPDELLVARDEGRVVFFCGAGVSRARAGLADFLGLARTVADKLAVAANSAAHQLINAIETSPSIPGVGGLISADRVFSLLEREFLSRDIYRAIAESLRPSITADLSAHRDILDLARGPNGAVKLVTTNFDLLFEACDSAVARWRPPRLPDPLRTVEFRGIVHLHGHVTDDYTDAAGDGFIISSAEFGHAYLSERWATEFIRGVLQKYLVVFIGYAADDPPMQYLLEALNRTGGSLSGVYAFQSGSIEDAQARWGQKGVKSIAYGNSPDHAALWKTLAAWAIRAKNPEEWYGRTLATSRVGPERLKPFERGQVAHIVSTLEGARKFAQAIDPPPATWLCTFDPSIRFSRPERSSSTKQGEHFDPFDAYGLDSDPVPAPIDPEDNFSTREVPRDVWNCFSLTRQDRQNLPESELPALRGSLSINIPSLVTRMNLIGAWLSKVAAQPSAVWWAANQTGLHPDIQQQIQYAIERNPNDFPKVVRQAWHYIIEAWAPKRDGSHRDWFQLTAQIKAEGWSNHTVRQFAATCRPHLTAQRAFFSLPKPPEDVSELTLADLVRLDVEYPSHSETVSIPDDHLPSLVSELRKNLELGVALEGEIGEYGLQILSPFERDSGDEDGTSHHLSGISKPALAYVGFFRKLLASSPHHAKLEVAAWQANSDPVFTRLKIWASGDDRLFAAAQAAKNFQSLKQDDFWNSRHQRDFMLSLSKRWSKFSTVARKKLERRLLRGRSRWPGEKRPDYIERRAFQTLSRIHWLASQGCAFNFDLDKETQRLRSDSPTWKVQAATHAVDSLESKSGWIRTDTDGTDLLNEPLANILSKAKLLSGRTQEFFVERDPFSGLVSAKPVRAFAALVAESKRGNYPDWAWRSFLNSENSRNKGRRLVCAVSVRISLIPQPQLAALAHTAADWLLKVSEILLRDRRDIFDRLWTSFIEAFRTNTRTGASSVLKSRDERDWATEALNAPVGSMAQALMAAPQTKPLKRGDGFPLWWAQRAEEILLLPDNLHRHALVIFAHNLAWFFAVDPIWTEKNLLLFCEKTDEDGDAFWAGFFWGAKMPQKDLYLRMKPALLRQATERSTTRRQHTETLAAIILIGWNSKIDTGEERVVSDAEMRSVLLAADDEFRSQIIWHLERWSQDSEGNWEESALVLLKDVWPRQIVAKTPRVTARLCTLAFYHDARFTDYVDAILPLVTKIEGDDVTLPVIRRSKDSIVDNFPERTLALLSAVLSDDVRKWPYGINDILIRIGNSNSTLLADARLIELTRKWNAR